ncbi:MAG: ABC transporter ATP-binding protein [Candidatus Absconditabacterales bacterium]
MNQEHDSLKKVGIKRILQYLRQKYMTEKKYFIPLFFSRILISFVGLIPAIYYKKIVDIVSSYSNGDKTSITVHAISILFIILWVKLLSVAIYRISDYLLILIYLNISKKIYLQSFNYVHRHSYRFFSNSFTGALIKKINKLVGAYDRMTDIFVYDISNIVFNSIFVLIIVGLQNIYFSIIFFVWMIIFITVQYFLYKRNYPYEIQANLLDSEISGALSDTITNNFNIKTFASLPREYKFFDKIITLRKEKNKIRFVRAILIRTFTGLMMVALEFAIFYMAIKLRNHGLVTVGLFVLLQIYIFRLMDQLWNIGNVFRYVYQSFSESAEMIEILDEPHEVVDKTTSEINVSQGKIDFQNVDFAYTVGKKIFDGLSLQIHPKEKLAIVGSSGGGKTTIIKLLFRFFDIQSGKILIDGQDISNFTQDSLRQSISMVPQDPVLFHRTIKENIAYGNPDASEEEILRASKMAKCHEFIMKLKYGYDTLVGERGIKLSGGERQRVAIARAMLENTKILVLDEATSSLDSHSEKLIQEAMDQVMKNKTTIIIAHRLSTIMKVDRIIVMENGKIIETGTHAQLLNQESGIYKKLWNIQSGGFLEE